jgi:phosphoglycolate phosphatase
MTSFPFDIVGFDLDGTLLDTHEDLGAAVNYALATLGRPLIPVSAVAGLIGGGARRMLERALGLTGGMPDEGLDAPYATLLAYYEAHIAVHTRPYPGTLEMLEALESRGARLAVASNKVERLTTMLLGELGLSHRFVAVLGGDTLGPGRAKPAPDMLHDMVRRLGGGRAVFVGDSSFDIRAARAAGLPSVAVSFGFNDVAPDQLGADAVIGHFDELVPLLEQGLANRKP